MERFSSWPFGIVFSGSRGQATGWRRQTTKWWEPKLKKLVFSGSRGQDDGGQPWMAGACFFWTPWSRWRRPTTWWPRLVFFGSRSQDGGDQATGLRGFFITRASAVILSRLPSDCLYLLFTRSDRQDRCLFNSWGLVWHPLDFYKWLLHSKISL